METSNAYFTPCFGGERRELTGACGHILEVAIGQGTDETDEILS